MTDASTYTLTTSEVAARLGVSQDTVSRWAKGKGLLCLVTPGGWRRFRPEDVDAFAASLLSGERAG